MPPPCDLKGRRFGQLVVIAAGALPECGRRDRMLWHVRCDCGREEAYAQYRLMRGEIDACSHCRGHPCAVCGVLIPARAQARATCSAECHTILRRDQWRLYARQKAIDDPEHRRRALLARKRRAATDEDVAARLRMLDRARIKRHQARMATDQAYAERTRAAARARYAANAETIQDRRRRRLAEMSAEELESWLDRMRSYARDYAKKRRDERARDPEMRQDYLAAQAEYRRRRSLSALMGEAAELTEEKRDD